MKRTAMMLALAGSLALASAADAKKPSGDDAAAGCLSMSHSWEVEGDVLIIDAQAADQCGRRVELRGTLSLILDGVEVASAPMGADERAALHYEHPLDAGAPSEACLRFDGTATAKVRGKQVSEPVAEERCQQLPPIDS